IFDSLNWLPNLQMAIDAVRTTGMLAEAAVCYTGDILDPGRTKYDLRYYIGLAKSLEKAGANLLAIKDMAGLCKPNAARLLVRAPSGGLGRHFHSHRPAAAGGRLPPLRGAWEEGVDIVDAAFGPLAGMPSQPSLNTLVEFLRFTPERDTGLDYDALQATA